MVLGEVPIFLFASSYISFVTKNPMQNISTQQTSSGRMSESPEEERERETRLIYYYVTAN